jgi:hypothetical protein
LGEGRASTVQAITAWTAESRLRALKGRLVEAHFDFGGRRREVVIGRFVRFYRYGALFVQDAHTGSFNCDFESRTKPAFVSYVEVAAHHCVVRPVDTEDTRLVPVGLLGATRVPRGAAVAVADGEAVGDG